MQQMNVLEYLEKTVTRVPEKTAFSNGEDSLNFAEVYGHSRSIGSRLAAGGYYNEPVVVFMGKHPKCIPSAASTAAVTTCPSTRRCPGSASS